MKNKRASIEVERIKNGRGFYQYGEPVICSYGSQVKVYESSSAEGPYVWLGIKEDSRIFTKREEGRATAHLNVEQTKQVIARLQAFIDDVPDRWDIGSIQGE